MLDITKRVEELRVERNWTEYQLAERAGLPQSTINSWYRKNTVPKITTIDKLCQAFGITMSQFFAEDDTIYDLTDVQVALLKYAAKLDEDQYESLIKLLKKL